MTALPPRTLFDESSWPAPARGALAALVLALPGVLVLLGAAAKERDAGLASAAILGAAGSVMLGAFLAVALRALVRLVRAMRADEDDEGLVTPLFTAGVAVIPVVLAVRALRDLPAPASIREAAEAFSGDPTWLVVLALLLTLLLVVQSPDGDEIRLQARTRARLVRSGTVFAAFALVILGAQATRLVERERFAPADREATAALLPSLEARARRHPDHAATHYRLGSALLVLGRVADAVAPLARTVALDPGDGWARNDLGLALRDAGRPAEAVPHLREAVRLLPDDPRPYRNLASSLWRDGEHAAAQRAYRALLERWPRDAEALAFAGVLEFEHGSRTAGASDVRRAFELDSASTPVRWAMARVLTAQGRFDDALPHYRAYLVAHAVDGHMWGQYGLAAFLASETDESLRAFGRAAALDSTIVEENAPLRQARDSAMARARRAR